MDTGETLEEQTYRRLLIAIQTGELAPGTRLVTTQLASTFHVSRITVANALKRLSSEGYVTSRPHRGAVVASLDEHDLREVFLIRHALEDIAVTETARGVDPALIDQLRDLDSAIRQALVSNDTDGYREHERAFHMLLYSASHLRLVSSTLMDLWNRLEPYRNRRHAELELELDSSDDRIRIIEALQRGDGPVAALEMRRHVDRGYDRILATLRHQAIPDHHRQATRRVRTVSGPPQGSLVAAFLSTTDAANRPQGRLYRPEQLLAAVALAQVAGVRSRKQIARWLSRLHPMVREALGMAPDALPSMATVHRAIQAGDIAPPLRQWMEAHGYDTGLATGPFVVEADPPERGEGVSTRFWGRFASLALHGVDRPSVESRHLADALRQPFSRATLVGGEGDEA